MFTRAGEQCIHATSLTCQIYDSLLFRLGSLAKSLGKVSGPMVRVCGGVKEERFLRSVLDGGGKSSSTQEFPVIRALAIGPRLEGSDRFDHRKFHRN